MDKNTKFPFELQILTYLQHSRDQLQQGNYELIRMGGVSLVKPETNAGFEELSSRLYELDNMVDRLRGQ